MTQKLIKHGHGLALVIDPSLLEIIGATEDTELTITTDGNALTITPVKSAEDEHLIAAKYATDEALKRYGGTVYKPSK